MGKIMVEKKSLITFGPVPSRRLGRSLGVNNIPPKVCSYSCVYCQVGKTFQTQIKRREFYKPSELIGDVQRKLQEAVNAGEPIDYITFVSDGEPTLDINLGKQIESLKQLGIKIAVISNASIIWRNDVRQDFAKADWVSLKIDSVTENIWKRINKPDESLSLDEILSGIEEFSRNYAGELITETMLVEGVNANDEELRKIAIFIAGLKKTQSYISIPIRPPAEKWVRPANEKIINAAYQIFKENGINVEYLIGYEGNSFSVTGDIEKDLLSITSVHPMRKDAVYKLLGETGADWSIIARLIDENKLREVNYKNHKFYMRKL